jgi:hypothetical protein
MDGSPLLGGRARSASSTTWTTLVALIALGALALTTRGAWKGEDATLEKARRRMPPYPQNPPGTGTPITYTLHVGCESSRVRSYRPTFWNSDIVEARIVRHNYPGGTKFFEWSDGLVMNDLANLQPGDTKTFELQTNRVNYEYGFALKNADGHIHYEVGERVLRRSPERKGTARPPLESGIIESSRTIIKGASILDSSMQPLASVMRTVCQRILTVLGTGQIRTRQRRRK